MPIDSVAQFAQQLRECQLLTEAQWEQIAAQVQDTAGDVRSLGRHLLSLGWLTPFQINRIVQGRSQELVLGHYLLLEQIGEGGMGTVYKARHRLMNRVVALKVIRKQMLANQDSAKRFRREIEAVARLSHPNVVMAHDADEKAGSHFFVMEFVEGTNLASLVKRQGPLPVAQACAYLRQAALGLQHAHEHGLVHRDIKPSNLLVAAKDNQLKVLDLGLARLNQDDGFMNSALTEAGMVMGTPDFMAPEQATNPHSVDIRADLYSLGATLYFLLTGKPPFPGGTLEQKLSWHLHAAPPSLTTASPEAPPALADVINRLLAKRPEDRFQTPAEVAAALAPFAGESSAPSPETLTMGVASPDFPTLHPPFTVASAQPRVARKKVVPIAAACAGALVVFFLLVKLFPGVNVAEISAKSKGGADKPDPAPTKKAAPVPHYVIHDEPRIFCRFGNEMEVGLWIENPDGTSYSLTYDNFAIVKAGKPVSFTNTLVRVDNKLVEFGSAAGKWEDKDIPLGKTASGRQRHGRQAVWSFESIYITQLVEVVPTRNKDPENKHLLDGCLLAYQIDNRADAPHQVGIRCFIDTMLGNRDSHFFQLPGRSEFISQPMDFPTPEAVPQYVKALEREDNFNPGLVAYVTLNVGGPLEPPGRFSIVDFNPNRIWNVPLVNQGKNAALIRDSGIVVYWQPREVLPATRRTLGYAYGAGLPLEMEPHFAKVD